MCSLVKWPGVRKSFGDVEGCAKNLPRGWILNILVVGMAGIVVLRSLLSLSS